MRSDSFNCRSPHNRRTVGKISTLDDRIDPTDARTKTKQKERKTKSKLTTQHHGDRWLVIRPRLSTDSPLCPYFLEKIFVLYMDRTAELLLRPYAADRVDPSTFWRCAVLLPALASITFLPSPGRVCFEREGEGRKRPIRQRRQLLLGTLVDVHHRSVDTWWTLHSSSITLVSIERSSAEINQQEKKITKRKEKKWILIVHGTAQSGRKRDCVCLCLPSSQ